MKFKNKWLKEIISEDSSKDNPLNMSRTRAGLGMADKYETKETVFKHDGKHYAIYESRSGPYYSDCWYDSDDWSDDGEQDCAEVEKGCHYKIRMAFS